MGNILLTYDLNNVRTTGRFLFFLVKRNDVSVLTFDGDGPNLVKALVLRQFLSRQCSYVYMSFYVCIALGVRLYDGPDLKLFILVGWGRSFLSVAWPTGVQLLFFFCSGVSKLFGAQGSPLSGSIMNL